MSRNRPLLADEIENKKTPSIRKKPSTNEDIINFYEIIPKKYIPDVKNPNYDLHNIEIPFRMCVVAPSGSGKTNFLLNLLRIFSQGRGTFSNIYIITSNKDEPLYNFLEGEVKGISISEGMSSTPKLDDMDKDENTLVVWDDLVIDKNQEKVKNFYMRARKRNCSVVYLSQSYYSIEKFIRLNANYLVLLNLGGSKRDQKEILKEWSTDLEPYQLMAIYNDATAEHMRPLIIKGGKVKKNEKYRKSWKGYYNLDEFLKDVEDPNIKKRLEYKKKADALKQTKSTKKPKQPILYDSSSDSDDDY